MKTLIAIILLITIPSVVCAEESTLHDLDKNVSSAHISSMIDGKPYAFWIKITDGLPAWKLGEKLPVEISELVSIAKTQLSLYTTGPETYIVGAVTVRRVGVSNHWYFVAEFVQIKGPNPRVRERLTIPVLLDGTPIKGELLKPRSR